jgi:hypothetical protein
MRINRFRRRDFVTLLGGATVAWPLAARAAADAGDRIDRRRIADSDADNLRAFRQTLKDTGYVEGAFLPDLESMCRDEMLKILLQQYRPRSGHAETKS